MKTLYKTILFYMMLFMGLLINAQDSQNFTILSNSINTNGQSLSIESTITKTNNKR